METIDGNRGSVLSFSLLIFKSQIYVKNLVNSGIKDNPPTFEYEIEIIDYQKFKDNLKKNYRRYLHQIYKIY